MIPHDIHMKIRAVRKERDFSQEYVANKSGYKQQDISEIEKGEKKVSIEILHKISNAMDVTPEYILSKEYYNPIQIKNENCSGNVGYNNIHINNDEKLIQEFKDIFSKMQEDNLKAFESILLKIIGGK